MFISKRQLVYIWLCCIILVLAFTIIAHAGSSTTQKEIYCKYKQYEVNRQHDLKEQIYSISDKKKIYTLCVESARAKLNFRRGLYSEYHINGQQLNLIYRNGKRYKWSCSWF